MVAALEYNSLQKVRRGLLRALLPEYRRRTELLSVNRQSDSTSQGMRNTLRLAGIPATIDITSGNSRRWSNEIHRYNLTQPKPGTATADILKSTYLPLPAIHRRCSLLDTSLNWAINR